MTRTAAIIRHDLVRHFEGVIYNAELLRDPEERERAMRFTEEFLKHQHTAREFLIAFGKYLSGEHDPIRSVRDSSQSVLL